MGGIMSDNIHINKNINIDKKEEKKPELLDDNRVAIIDMQHESEDEKAVRIQTLFDNAKKRQKTTFALRISETSWKERSQITVN
jgi:hypothetical protein